MSSTVLVVDAGTEIRDIVERHVDAGTWTIALRDDVEVAWNDACTRAPDLVVLNADVAKGWNLCAQLKRRFPAVPVVLLSYKANQELFNNHQKLPTRADAYHHLPKELDGLSISLSYFSSHKSEVDEEEAPKRQRGGGRVNVPTGVVQKLESTVHEQAREIEGLKRQMEALEAERDAVSEKARRQMIELMAVAPGPDLSGEVAGYKRRIHELEGELDAVRAAARDASDRAQLAQESVRNAVAAAEQAQGEMIAMRSQSRAAGNTAEQLSMLTAQLAQAEQRRIAAETERGAAVERAVTAERAWSGLNTRAEELHQAMQLRGQDVERITKEKSDVETTLAMSRKLMKDYINEAARNAESARVAIESGKAAEARASAAEQAVVSVQGEMEFQKALAESLEESLKQAAEKAEALGKQAQSLESDLGVAREAGSAHAARALALDDELTRAKADNEALATRVASLASELATRTAALGDEVAAASANALLEKAGLESAAASEKAALEARMADAKAAHEGAFAAQSERFESLRAWAKKLDGRFAEIEMTRDAVLARLQSLVDDMRSLPNGIEPAPVSLSED